MVIGISLAMASVVILSFFSYEKKNEILSSLLAGIAGIYVGFALMDGRTEQIIIESIVTVLFIVITLLSRWRSTYILGAGYILHGIWDYLHHSWISTEVMNGYPTFCSVYDIIIGIYIISYHYVKKREG